MSAVRHWVPLGAVLLAVVLTAACSHEDKLRCESNERYAASRTMPPLRIPEGLNAPDETDVLRIPGASAAETAEPEQDQSCIEFPPDFESDDNGE